MDDERTNQPTREQEDFAREVQGQAKRKLRMQRDGTHGVWFGLGMSGLIGWSVAVPTLMGAMLGLWLDRHHPGTHSWTLMFMVIGLVIGCANAWRWVDQQDKSMREPPEDNDE